MISSSNDNSIRSWNYNTWKENFSIELPAPRWALALYQNGIDRTCVIVAGNAGYIQSFVMKEREQISMVSILMGSIHWHCIRVERFWPLETTSEVIRLQKVNGTGEVVDSEIPPWFAHQGVVYSMVWSKDGSRLISTGIDGRVMAWNMETVRSAEPEDSNWL